VFLHGVWTRTLADRMSMGVEPATDPWKNGAGRRGTRHPRGHLPKKPLLWSWLRKTHLKSMDRGSGPQRSGEPLGASGQMPLPCQSTGRCSAQLGQASLSGEVRQENAFTEACRLPGLPDRLSALCSPSTVSSPWGQRPSCSSSQRCSSSLAYACLC
jgi:hypothetical protein